MQTFLRILGKEKSYDFNINIYRIIDINNFKKKVECNTIQITEPGTESGVKV